MGKYLDFYKKAMETGRMPSLGGGLCNAFGFAVMDFFEPPKEEFPEHWVDGFTGFFAYDGEPLTSHQDKMRAAFSARGLSFEDVWSAFTPMRQTIVLFLAAIHDEDFNELKK